MSLVEIILFVLYITLSLKVLYLLKWIKELREYTDRNFDAIVEILEERKIK